MYKINVAVGDVVESDDEVVVLEALKMEIPVFNAVRGKVVKIAVNEGDKVIESQVLMVIE